MAIALPDETKKALIESIKCYFLEERDEKIGDLQASFFLEFILKEVGPSIYNQAIKDAQSSLQGAVADLDITLHEPELGYTAERGARRTASRRAVK
ncbi:MAG: DUF2164 domain-containing protein [Rhodothermales bacterium]